MMVCLKCGDLGIMEALVYCCKCKLNPQHFYCLERLPETIDINVEWFCHECKPENHLGRLFPDLTAQAKPTLPPLKTSVSVTEERMHAGHEKFVRKEVIELEVEVEVAATNSQIQSDCAESSRSEDIPEDTDGEDAAEKDKTGKQKGRDIAWMHAVRITKPKNGLVCNYCSRAMMGRGSITRLKEHLAGGYDSKTIKSCPKVPPEVQYSMKKIVEEKEKLKAAFAAKAHGNGLEIIDFSGRVKARKDPAWKYAYPVDGKVNSMVCNFCSQTISGGGITRFKHHLAEKCIQAPLEVQVEMANMLTKKDIDKADFDANVDKIKGEMRDMTSHWYSSQSCDRSSSSQSCDRPSSSQSQGTYLMDSDKIVNFGPIDDSTLSQQTVHCNEKVSNHLTINVLEIKYRRMWALNLQLTTLIARAGFYPWVQIQNIALDWALVTALVEHWRPETHTFHFRPAELTITLQDVAMLTGLPVDGDVITGKEESKEYWSELCIRLLGVVPDMDKKSPTMAKKSWFRNHMKTVPENASADDLIRYARAYILVMIGSTLMPDTSGDRISLIYLPLLEDLDRCRQYSWGSAVLAVLSTSIA